MNDADDFRAVERLIDEAERNGFKADTNYNDVVLVPTGHSGYADWFEFKFSSVGEAIGFLRGWDARETFEKNCGVRDAERVELAHENNS